MLTAEELEYISKSFDESLRSRLWSLSPASVSLTWFSSAVEAITFAHSAARSLIYEINLDDGDSLSSWFLEDSLKVLDICNCISSEIEGLRLRHQKLRLPSRLLRGKPTEEEIHQARDLLADLEGEGGGGYVNQAGNVEGLIIDLAASIGTSAPPGKVSPVERVVSRAIRAVSFLMAFIARIVSSALHSSLREVVSVRIPEEFPWGDSIRAIEAAVIVESEWCDAPDMEMEILKELDDMEARVKELVDVEASASHVLEAIDDVVASGGDRETMRRLGEAAIGLEKVTEIMMDRLSQLTAEVNELLLTVTRMRKEVDELRASVRK